MKHLLITTIVSVKDILTCELVPMSEQKVMRVAMFVMGGLLLALGVWKMPTLDLGLSGLIIGWMAQTVVVGQCIVAGLLSGRYRLERGFRINGQIVWMLVGAAIFIGAILGFSWLEGITLAQLQLGCLLAVMMLLNCFILGLLWPLVKKTNGDSDDFLRTPKPASAATAARRVQN